MLRRAALWLTVPALAATAACGSPAPAGESADRPGAPSTVAPVEQPAVGGDPDRPVIGLPADVTVTFETPAGLDDESARLVADFEQYRRVRAAVVRVQDMDDPRWSYYMTDGFRASAQGTVLSYREDGRALFGHWQLFDVRVTALDEDTATLVHCDDQGRVGILDPDTGEVTLPPTPADEPSPSEDLLEWTVDLVKDGHGVWRVEETRPEGHAEHCRR